NHAIACRPRPIQAIIRSGIPPAHHPQYGKLMSEQKSAPQRFKQIPPENLTPEQRVLADGVRSGPRGAVKNSSAASPGALGGPFNVWLRTPEIGNLIQSLGAAIRFRSSLPPKLNELAIIVTARHWTAQYEW